MLDAFRAYLSRIDERPVEEIDRDIDDELASHLELLERELLDSGLSADAARKEALSRFGNPQTHRRRCRDVALMERRMKTYAQMIVTVVCGLLLGAVTTMVWLNQQTANAALVKLDARLEELSRSASMRVNEPTAPASNIWRAYVTGTPVSHPGVYTMPYGGLSLRRLLASAGVDYKSVKEVIVRHRNENTPDLPHETLLGRQLADPAGPDVMLQHEDLVTVIDLDKNT